MSGNKKQRTPQPTTHNTPDAAAKPAGNAGRLSRRGFLGAAAASTFVVGLASYSNPTAAAKPLVATGSEGAATNGWPTLTSAKGAVVEGTDVTVNLANDDVTTVLHHVVRRFHYDIDVLEPGEVVSWHSGGSAGSAAILEAGAAVAIRPDVYPPGAAGELTDADRTIIDDILAELDGAVAWGGDDAEPQEGLFYIAQPPGHPSLARAAERIRSWDSPQGQGLGAGAVTAFDPERIEAAQHYQTTNR